MRLNIIQHLFPMLGSTVSSVVAVLCIWGSSKSFAPLLAFGLLYRLFAGGYSALYCRFATALTNERAMGLWLYSIFEFQLARVIELVGPSVAG
jgi:hypothetical protein